MKTNHEGKRLECEKCGKSYTLRYSLRKHLDWHDLKEHGLKFICKQCHKTFSSREIFGRHVRTQHKGLRFVPEIVMDVDHLNLEKERLKASKPKKGK